MNEKIQNITIKEILRRKKRGESRDLSTRHKMDVSIILEHDRIVTTVKENGEEVQFRLGRKAPEENPFFIDDHFKVMPMVYVNDEVFKKIQKN